MKKKDDINKSYLHTSMSFKDDLYASFLIKRARKKIDRLVSKTNNTTILKVSN